jgi:hypothetical protein
MADISDVANALVNLISAALYPNGTGAVSAIGLNTIPVYRGSPGQAKLDSDMQSGFTQVGGAWQLTAPAAQIVHVTVNPHGAGRLRPPYTMARSNLPTPPAVTITAAVSGTTVTLAGTVAAAQGAAIVANNVPFGAVAGTGGTLATLATALAAGLTAAGVSATASGAVVTVPGATQLAANGFVQVAATKEWRRQAQGFEVTIYAPGRNLRDQAGSFIDQMFAQIKKITLADNFAAKLDYVSVIDDDRPEKDLLFLKRLFYQVEYPTTAQKIFSTIAVSVVPVQTKAGVPIETLVSS